MKRRLQFAGWLMALAMSAAAAVPSFAQGPRVNWAQNRQDNKPPKQQSQAPRQPPPREQPRRQEQRLEQRREQQQQQETRRAQNERQNSGANRPPNANMNRAETATRPSFNSNRPPSAYTPPLRREFNNLSPQEKQKVLDNNRRLQNLPPAMMSCRSGSSCRRTAGKRFNSGCACCKICQSPRATSG
jgi:hypothetical protein